MENNVIKEVLITMDQIESRCKELGSTISEAYKGKSVLLVGLLKGSVPFMAELIKHIEGDIEIDFMDVSSYEGTESIGDIKINKDLDQSIKGLNILIVEDIVDTGRTLKTVKTLMYNKGAADVKIVSLLDKPERRIVDVDCDYVGFQIPDAFVVGFGLDYNQKYRQLPLVGILDERVYTK